MEEIKKIELQIDGVLNDLTKRFDYKLVDRLHELRVNLKTAKERGMQRTKVFQERIEIIK